MAHFDTLAAASPALAALLADAQAAAPADPAAPWCAAVAWPAYKARLTRLVGWFAPADTPALLCTHDAYETAYHRILQALPSCRAGCGCGEGEEADRAA